MANYSCKTIPYNLTLSHNTFVTDDGRRRTDGRTKTVPIVWP